MIGKNQQQEIDAGKPNMDNASMSDGSRESFKAGLKEINFRTAALLQSCGSCRGGVATAPHNSANTSEKHSSLALAV